jgi:hypothetical protein
VCLGITASRLLPMSSNSRTLPHSTIQQPDTLHLNEIHIFINLGMKPYNLTLTPLNPHATTLSTTVYPTSTANATLSLVCMLCIATFIAPVKRFAYPPTKRRISYGIRDGRRGNVRPERRPVHFYLSQPTDAEPFLPAVHRPRSHTVQSGSNPGGTWR